MVIFKLIPKMIITAALVVAVLPLNAFAISSTDSSSTTAPEAGDKTRTRTQATPAADEKASEQKQLLKCEPVEKMVTKIKEQQSQKKTEIESKRNKIRENTTDRQDEREKTLSTKRAEWDSRRQDNFTKLRTKAATDTQKEAVEVYIKTVTTAIAKHRATNDAAFAEFRLSVAGIKADVSRSVKTNITNSSAQVETAIADAKIACAAGQGADSVRQSLQAQLQTARAESKQERQSIDISQKMKEVVQKRRDAVKASAAAFKVKTLQAREALLMAFKDDSKIIE